MKGAGRYDYEKRRYEVHSQVWSVWSQTFAAKHARGRRGLAHLDLHGFSKAAIKSASRAIEPCLAAASLAVVCLALLYLPHWFGAQFQDGPSLHPPGRSLVPLPSRLVQAFPRR